MLLGLGAIAAPAQTVPGFTVQEYATVNGPIEMTFDPGGVMYVGRSLFYSGGDYATPCKIHRIGVGGLPVTEYGDSEISDPDAVFYDATGAFTGTAGAIMVTGAIGANGAFHAVLPDESVVTFFGPDPEISNPNALRVDSTGRMLIADDNEGQVYAYPPGGPPSLLFTLPTENGSLAIDAADNIYTAAIDGVIRIHDPGGSLIDDAFVTGLSGGRSAPLAFGPSDPVWGDCLYAIDRGAGELLRIDSVGDVTVIGTGFGGADRFAASIAFGPDDAMYVSFVDEDRIIRIVPEPATLALLGVGSLLLRRRR